jgi:hypothetical protein
MADKKREFSAEQMAYMRAKAAYQCAPTAANRKALRDAETALITWGREQVEKLPQYAASAAELEPLWKMAETQDGVRARVVDMTMRMDAVAVV